jgi:hypothetical protein
MDDIAFAREIRRQRAFERLGSTQPACCRCPEDNPHCLMRRPISEGPLPLETQIVCRNYKAKENPQRDTRRRKSDNRACLICGEGDQRCLEDHHIGGRKYDQMTVITCSNCHSKLTDIQKDHPT